MEEAVFPVLDGGSGSVEDIVIPLFPDVPCCYSKDLHEKGMLCGCLSYLHHSKKFCVLSQLMPR
jgi:hypothetical protein